MTSTNSSISIDSTLLRTALDCAPGGLFFLQLYRDTSGSPVDFRILLLNKAAERLVGRSEADLLGRSARQHLSTLVPKPLWKKAFVVCATDEAYHELTWLTGRDGSRRRYDLTLCPHPDGVALSYQDVTELEEKKNLLEGIITHSPNGIVALEALRENGPEGTPGAILDFRTRFHNARAAEVLGVGAKYFQKNLFERRPEIRSQLEEQQALLSTGQGIDQEFFYPPTQRWLDVRTRRLDENSFFSIYQDITDLKQAQLKIERQNDLLQGIMNTSLSAITVYEPVCDEAGTLVDLRVKLSNPMSLQFSQRRADEVIGKTMTEIYPLTKTLGLWQRYAEVYESGESDRVEHHYPHIDRWFDVSMSKLGNGLVVTFQDITDRKQTEMAVQRQNLVLEGVMNASLNGISVWEALRDEQGGITDFKLLRTNEAATARTLLRTVPIEQAETLLNLPPQSKTAGTFYQQVGVVETGQPFRRDVHLPDGNRWYDLAITKLGDGTVVTFNEITEQKRATEKIEEQARLFDGVLAGLTNGMTVLEAVRDEFGTLTDFRYLAVADANLRDTGLTREHFMNGCMTQLFTSVKESEYWRVFSEVLSTGISQQFETHYTNDGFDNWLDNIVSRFDENRLISVYTLVNDQKQASIRNEKQAHLLDRVLNGSLNGILAYQSVRDATGTLTDLRIVLANAAAATITGVAHEVMLGSTMKQQYPSADESGLFARYAHTVESGENQRFEAPYYTDGLEGWYDIAISRMDDGMVMSFLDVTERKLMQVKQDQLVEELKRSNADLEQFAYVASHDLSEPLRKIRAFSDRLLTKHAAGLEPEGFLFLERMSAAAHRMQALIDNLLNFSRLTRRGEKLRPTDLSNALALVLDDLDGKICEKQARIDVTGTLPEVLAVPGQMEQVFQNLLTNALKFCDSDIVPEIRISSELVPVYEKIALGFDPALTYVQLRVTDNGIGFEPQYAGQIFEIFKRLHGRSEYDGTGIGLSIVKKIVENHGGLIRAESQPGQGATFVVVLPVGK